MSYDEWKTSPPDDQKEPEVVAKCEFCKSDIHEGTQVIYYNGDYFDTEDCYFEQLCADNPPAFEPVRS